MLIAILYGRQYLFASRLLPPLALSAWFGILSLLHENVFLGLGQPSWGAIGNAIKLAGVVLLLPLLVTDSGIAGAAIATLAAKMLRCAAFVPAQFLEQMVFVKQDLGVTVLLSGVVIAPGAALHAAGLTTSLVL